MKKMVSIFIGVLAAVFILAGCSDVYQKAASSADDNCLTEMLTIPVGVTRIDTKAFSNYKADTVIIEATNLVAKNFNTYAFPGNLQSKYVATYPAGAGGPGTYTRTSGTATTWTKQ